MPSRGGLGGGLQEEDRQIESGCRRRKEMRKNLRNALECLWMHSFPSARAFLGFTVCGLKSALQARWNQMLRCKT